MAQRKAANKRPERTPISGNRDILTVDGKDEEYVYRWMNDMDNRIQRALDGGYNFVTDDGKQVGTRQVDNPNSNVGSVVSKDVGKGVTSYLMALPRDLYEQDQAAKHSDIDSTEASLRKSGQDGNYGSVKISKL